MEQNAKLLFQVNKIIQMHHDRILGYQKAISLTADSRMQSIFEQCMQQSYYFQEKLQAAMSLQGMQLNAGPSWTGTLFRAWMVCRTRLSPGKDKAVLRSCLTAENMLNLSYELLCSDKYLQYYFPLLKFTFLKQHFTLKKTREQLDRILERLNRAHMPGVCLETDLHPVEAFSKE